MNLLVRVFASAALALPLAGAAASVPTSADLQTRADRSVIASADLPTRADRSVIAPPAWPTSGHDAGFCGYAWTDAIAADLATEFEPAPNGFLNPGAGRRTRDT